MSPQRRLLLLLAVAGLMLVTVPQVGSAAGEDPVLVGEDVAGDAGLDPTFEPLGVDAIKIFIHRPDFDKKEIEFIIQVTTLDSPPPPEIIRYLWNFKIDGVKEYLIQAKTSDIVTTAFVDDPPGALTHVGGAFRLRGDCVVMVAKNCKHLKWLDGEFDLANNQVKIRVPLDDPVATAITAGATVEPGTGAEAGFQAVLSSANTTTDLISQTESYTIPAGA